MAEKILSGTVHKLPADLKKEISSSKETLEKWNSLTPLGRNEYICWITSAKKDETRMKRIDWMRTDILKGKRRPCCWPGCSHR
ncbi:YdeI/OmpD-associated family protein [Candidatus Woesearchaeota archaeon]|nr:YdeI/OmpD-associated family protein [Candidatus Woesearchaeota archaeon]